MTRPRLRDVAELAHVSEPTVSRVLNGRRGVASETRGRVIEALATLGFHDIPTERAPQRAARRGVIGIVCGEFENPVFPTLVYHTSTDLGRKGLLASVMVTDPDLSPEQRCIDEHLLAGVDGIVLLSGRHAEVDADLDMYRSLIDAHVPIVLVNGAATDLHVPHVRCDEHEAARKAATHLLRLGHTQIGCLLGADRYVPTDRFVRGYRASIAAAGLTEPDGAIIDTAFTIEGGRAGATRLIDRGVTAVICGNDLIALGAVQAATSRGLTVPGHLSVVGYDGTDLTSYMKPPLTTLRQPFDDMSQLVVDAMISEIDGTRRFRDHFVFEPQLIVRDTTGPPAPATAALGVG